MHVNSKKLASFEQSSLKRKWLICTTSVYVQDIAGEWQYEISEAVINWFGLISNNCDPGTFLKWAIKKDIHHEKLTVLWRCWKWFSVSYGGIMRVMKDLSRCEQEIVIFSSSAGHTMLSDKSVCNKIWVWNITSSIQNFISFTFPKKCAAQINPFNAERHHILAWDV